MKETTLLYAGRIYKDCIMKKEHGFSLIEMLIVTATIAVLSATAIAQFGNTKGKAFDKRALSTLRNVVGALENYYADNEIYAACDQDTCETVLNSTGLISKGVQIEVSLANDDNDFNILAFHSDGTESYQWDTENGGLQ